MGAKTLPLPFGGILVPVVVESGFTNGDDLRVVGEVKKAGFIRLFAVSVVRVNTDRGEQTGLAVGNERSCRT